MTDVHAFVKASTKTNHPLARKLLAETVKSNPKFAASLYFDVFDNLLKSGGESQEYWDVFHVLVAARINPLSVQNKDGLNPLAYFYQKNREQRLFLHSLSKEEERKYLGPNDGLQNPLPYESIANRLWGTFINFGFSPEQLVPIQKTKNLWTNYQRLLYKESQGKRVAFARLYQTVLAHPEDAVGVVDFQYAVQERLKLEEKREEEAWQRFHQQRNAGKHPDWPVLGHARGYIPTETAFWHMGYLRKPLPSTSREALDDFLLSLKDESAHGGLKMDNVLPEKWVKIYKRALNPPKRFERTR